MKYVIIYYLFCMVKLAYLCNCKLSHPSPLLSFTHTHTCTSTHTHTHTHTHIYTHTHTHTCTDALAHSSTYSSPNHKTLRRRNLDDSSAQVADPDSSPFPSGLVTVMMVGVVTLVGVAGLAAVVFLCASHTVYEPQQTSAKVAE